VHERTRVGRVVRHSRREHAGGAQASRIVWGPERVSVRRGYLPWEEVAELWARIESALLNHGLLGSGAIGPNEIVVFSPDPKRAREVVESFSLLRRYVWFTRWLRSRGPMGLRIRRVAICVAVPDRTRPDWTDEEGRRSVQDRTRADVAGSDGRASRNC
jgi:hypothetical protein